MACLEKKKVSLYIHIPFCVSKCRYCDFFSVPCGKVDVPDNYFFALSNEIKFRLAAYGAEEIATIYIGGGTPSLINPSQIKSLFNSIRKVCNISEDSEITIEVNPDDVTKDMIYALSEAGINRISCGIQSMNEQSLKYAGRRADAAINKRAIDLLKKYWNKQLSLDLISALPYETIESFSNALEIIVDASPSHVSLYSLTFEDETPFGKELKSGKLKYNFEQADDMWLFGKDFLEKNGYVQYEVSNFAKNNKKCRHNLVYWEHGDYIGAGSGATGTLYDFDVKKEGDKYKGEGIRWTNTLNISEYIEFWEKHENLCSQNQTEDFSKAFQRIPQSLETITLDNSEFEFFMMSLRKTEGFLESDYKRCFEKEMPSKFLEVFTKWQKKGLAQIKEYDNSSLGNTTGNKRYYLNGKGIMFLNSFLEDLL